MCESVSMLICTGNCLLDTSIIYTFIIYRSIKMPGNPASYPKWITSINKSYGDRVQMTASQVHAMLKEKAKQRYCSGCYI